MDAQVDEVEVFVTHSIFLMLSRKLGFTPDSQLFESQVSKSLAKMGGCRWETFEALDQETKMLRWELHRHRLLTSYLCPWVKLTIILLNTRALGQLTSVGYAFPGS